MARAARIWPVVFLLWAGNLQAAPKLQIDPEEFDFGMVAPNSTVAFQTWLYAAGDDTITISDIKTGCGCLVVSMESNRISPGDSLKVALLWQIRAATGETSVSPYLLLGAGRLPYRLSLSAAIMPVTDTTLPVAIQPAVISFEEPLENDANTARFRIANHTDREFAVEVVSGSGTEYQLDLAESIPANSLASGSVTISDLLGQSEFERSFTVEFRHDSRVAWRQTIPITVGDFSFRPVITTSIEETKDEKETTR